MADEKRIDPRYDPAFQRGFEGAVASGPRGHRVAQPSPEIVTPAPFRAAPERETTAADAGAAAGGPRQPADGIRSDASRAEGAGPDGPVPTGDRGAEQDGATPARRLRSNPFLIALVVLGLALTIGGLTWANQARLLVSGRGAAATDLDYWFLQATVTGAPLTIVAGISILAGVLFVAAIAWNRGR